MARPHALTRRAATLGLVAALAVPLAVAGTPSARVRTETQKARYVVPLSNPLFIIRPRNGNVGGVTFMPPAGASSVAIEVVDDAARRLGRPTSATVCQDGPTGDFCDGVRETFCTARSRRPIPIADDRPIQVAVAGLTVCGSEPAVGTSGTVIARFFITDPPDMRVLSRKNVSRRYNFTVGTGLLYLNTVTLTPAKGANFVEIAIKDDIASAQGRGTSAIACQDFDDDGICGETDAGEPSQSFCTRTARPMAINAAVPVSLLIDSAGVCDAQPATGLRGEVKASFLRATVEKKAPAARVHPPTVAGSVLVPLADVGQEERGVSRTRFAQCAYLQAPDQSQGLFGWVTPVRAGRKFEVRDASVVAGLADWEIVFVRSLGTCDDGPVEVRRQHRNKVGDERGVVPKDAKVAIITLYTGAPRSEFHYLEQ